MWLERRTSVAAIAFVAGSVVGGSLWHAFGCKKIANSNSDASGNVNGKNGSENNIKNADASKKDGNNSNNTDSNDKNSNQSRPTNLLRSVFSSIDENRRSVLQVGKSFDSCACILHVALSKELLPKHITYEHHLIAELCDLERRMRGGYRPKTMKFVAIEGLACAGRTSVVQDLCNRYPHKFRAIRLSEVMETFENDLKHFPRTVRDAYACMKNYYLASKIIEDMENSVIMDDEDIVYILDSYYHRTCSEALCNQVDETSLLTNSESWWFQWPSDLIQPSLVIFLVASNEDRLARFQLAEPNIPHSLEEVSKDASKVQMVYSMVSGPQTVAIDASGSISDTSAVVVEAMAEYGVFNRPKAMENKRASLGVYGALSRYPF